MLDATSEQERQAVGINPPHERPDPQREPLRWNELQPYCSSSLQPRLGPDFRTMRADVDGLARISTGLRFDHYRP